MTSPTNREIEQYYFSQFISHFPLPHGKIEYGDKPDVMILGERKLGIEIANLYLADGADPESEQVQRKWREAVVREAKRRYSLAGGKNIVLTVAFNPGRPIIDIQTVATALATFAESIQQLPAGALPFRSFEHIPQLSFVYHNPEWNDGAPWRLQQTFSGRNLSVDRVTLLVAIKELLLIGYRPCDAYWLLLVVDFMDSAQDQELTWPDNQPPLKTTYERVLIYKPQFARWIEVPVEKWLPRLPGLASLNAHNRGSVRVAIRDSCEGLVRSNAHIRALGKSGTATGCEQPEWGSDRNQPERPL